jgi:hypothetical protein
VREQAENALRIQEFARGLVAKVEPLVDPTPEPTGEPESLLDKAKALINGDRKRDYGCAREDSGRIALMWSAIFGVSVSPTQVPLAMICVKISRHLHRPKADNVTDIAGYAGLLELFLPSVK